MVAMHGYHTQLTDGSELVCARNWLRQCITHVWYAITRLGRPPASRDGIGGGSIGLQGKDVLCENDPFCEEDDAYVWDQ